ncbi:MAG: hypothetical protein HMLKMBBP_00600 [Planctomycetes bacterium]|nr:hypothetical protein [Planctomycetota bacterium]
MRTLALTAAAAASLLAAAAPARADEVVVPSRISRVTVYEDRAMVQRTAKVRVAEGTQRVVLAGFPAGFDASSLRARSAGARVLGVDTETLHRTHEKEPRAEQARLEFEAANRKVAATELALADAKDELDRLRSIRAVSTQRAGESLGTGGPDPKSVESMLEMIEKRLRVARMSFLDAQMEHQHAVTEADAAARRHADAVQSLQRSETQVVVTLSASAAAEADVTVQYAVGNAGWTPVYDLRVAEDFGAAGLDITAVVTQSTGEDWSGVPLEVTTAQPSAGAAPPEPSAWQIDILRPRPASGGESWDAGPAAPALRRVALEEKLKDDSGFVAHVRKSGVVVAFESPTPAQVRSGGGPVRVALGRFDLAPEVVWTAFPRATDKVYVTAKVKNTTGTALPAGQARVFVGPDFVGAMAFEDWSVDEELVAGLGADREVECARETLLSGRSTEGVFSKDTVHERSYRITLKNRRARKIDVRLLDQVPVSGDEELKVAITQNSAPLATLPAREAEDNKARGVLEWRFPVDPGKETDVRFAFRVTHPQGVRSTFE